jgi:hypothetical protein
MSYQTPTPFLVAANHWVHVPVGDRAADQVDTV